MDQRDSKSCSFLCFRDCNNSEQNNNQRTIPSPNFEKLSLKKIKEDHKHMVRTSSYRRIERPIPTTERSQQGTQAYLAQLIEKKKKVQRQIDALNNDFDRYYEMYASKLKQLKELQTAMNQQFQEKIRK